MAAPMMPRTTGIASLMFFNNGYVRRPPTNRKTMNVNHGDATASKVSFCTGGEAKEEK